MKIHKMCVAHVVKGLRLAGLEKVVQTISSNIEGYSQIICIEEKYEGPVVENLEVDLEEKNIKLFNLNRPENKAQRDLPIKYKRLFEKEQVGIVHTHSGVWRDALVGGKLAGIPLHFHTEHGIQNSFPSIKKKATFFLLSKLTSHIIAVSNETKKKLNKIYRIPENNVSVIWNGIDCDAYKPLKDETIRSELCIPKNTIVIGTVGRIVPLKDHLNLVKAFAIVNKVFPDTCVVIVGREDTSYFGEKSKIIDQAKKLGIRNKVIFTGERKDIAKVLNIFDVFVLNSWTEGISISLLEAGATGIPIVATDVGGNPEIIKNRENGFLVQVRDPDKLAKIIMMLVDDLNLRKFIGKNARDTVLRNFSAKTMAAKYRNLYDTFVAKLGK